VVIRYERNDLQSDRVYKQTKQKQTPWPLVRERTIPTERPSDRVYMKVIEINYSS
jgi:hypothetical protein